MWREKGTIPMGPSDLSPCHQQLKEYSGRCRGKELGASSWLLCPHFLADGAMGRRRFSLIPFPPPLFPLPKKAGVKSS